MSVITESQISEHIRSFSSHQFYKPPLSITNELSCMLTNMSRIGVGVITSTFEYDRGQGCQIQSLMTDSYGHTVESSDIAERKLFLIGDKIIAFQMFSESTHEFFTFFTLAK